MSSNTSNAKWRVLTPTEKTPESTLGVSIPYWKDVLRRFCKNKLAVGGIIVIIVMIFASAFGPLMTGKSYETQDSPKRNMPPILKFYKLASGERVYVHQDLRVFPVGADGVVGSAIEPIESNIRDKKYIYEIDGATYYLTFRGDGIVFRDANDQPITDTSTGWNKNNLLGTDSVGRDMLTRLLYGGRISLMVAFVTSFFTLVIGILYGGISGYYGGNVDVLMMRFVEIMMAIPSTIYIILLMVYFGQGVTNILIAMAATSWLGMARLVRGQVLSLKQQEYVLVAESIGVSPLSIITRHLLPNCLGPIIVSATLSIPGAIGTEAFMSFIGLGVAPPMPSWGILSSEGIGAIRTSPYQILLPCIAIGLMMFAFNFLGDGLRDALDPKLRK